MAISINKVYQKVLALANKEQRGYITPQEFNLFADYAQMEIFEQYFYNLEQRQRGTGNSTSYADIQENIEEKLANFEKFDEAKTLTTTDPIFSSFTINNSDFYRLGVIRVRSQKQISKGSKRVGSTRISFKELTELQALPLTMPTENRPVYTIGEYGTGNAMGGDLKVRLYPVTAEAFITYISKPTKPNWTYVISGENALYNDNDVNLKDFELHASEEVNLVNKILQLAGVSIKDIGLAQLAGNKDQFITQQQKQ